MSRPSDNATEAEMWSAILGQNVVAVYQGTPIIEVPSIDEYRFQVASEGKAMSGHLLSTVNAAAAEAIQPVPHRQPLPCVGEIVQYTMRPGHGRNGRTRFPALVMGEQGGKLLLTVIIDAGDMVDESHVEEAGPGAEFHCWERPQPTAVPGIHGTIAALHERVGELEEENRKMREVIFGGYNIPKVALFEIFAKLETRLKAVEAKGRK